MEEKWVWRNPGVRCSSGLPEGGERQLLRPSLFKVAAQRLAVLGDRELVCLGVPVCRALFYEVDDVSIY